MIAHTSLVYVVHKYKLYIIYYNLTSDIGEKLMTHLHLQYNTKHEKGLQTSGCVFNYYAWNVYVCDLSSHYGPKSKKQDKKYS